MNLRNNFSSTVEEKKEQQQVVQSWRARLKVVKEANTVYPPSVMKKKNKTIERKAFLLAWLIAWSAGLLWLACESSY